jgi:DNA-directed RNA polymerase specialized sigma subunit
MGKEHDHQAICAGGIARSSARRVDEFQRQVALKRKANGETLADIGWTFGVSHSTISRLG